MSHDCTPDCIQFFWHGFADDLTIEHSVDSQATWVIDVLGLSFDMLSLGVCTTRQWHMSGGLVQEFNVCTVGIYP